MENSRTPRRAPDALTDALERALAPWIEHFYQEETAPDAANGAASSAPVAPIALALSGGLDSTVLLHVSARLLKHWNIKLIAIHVNHALSAHANQWARDCARMCETLGIEFIEAQVTVPKQASLEAAARQVRYQALSDKALERGAEVLLTAHHANDQAETVLLNVLRGSGVAGLRGIAARRQLGALTLLRPFLEIERETLREYAKNHDLSWVEDDSNSNLRFRRNALRQEVMPAILGLHHDAIERLAGLARHASASSELLDELAAIDLNATREDGGLALPRLAVLGRVRSANLLRYWLKLENYGVPTENAVDEWLDQLLSGSDNIELDLAGRQFAVQDAVLKPMHDVSRASLPPLQLAIQWRGESTLAVPDWRGMLHFDEIEGTGIAPARIQHEPLSLRQRAGGERIQIALHAPSRTLKNLYQERGIRAAERHSLPLVYCGEDLLFAAGLGMNLRQCETGQQRISLRWVPSS